MRGDRRGVPCSNQPIIWTSALGGLRVRRLLAALWLGVGCHPGDPLDPSFDTTVADPAFSSDGPLVLFDEGHRNIHRAAGSYRPFVELIEADGFRVTRSRGRLDRRALDGSAVLVVACALGTNDRNDAPAFDAAEASAVQEWVRTGGGFLLITDHYPTGHAAVGLGRVFGIEMSLGVVEDPVQHHPDFDASHLLFTRQNGGLADHPILDGRDPSERVDSVLTFTGQAVRAGPPAAALLRLSDTAVARSAEPRVEERGGDVVVQVVYGEPVPATGWAQGLALTFGSGRVVVLGEAAMLSARLRASDGRPIGMNVEGFDNRRLALNAVHWLAGLL